MNTYYHFFLICITLKDTLFGPFKIYKTNSVDRSENILFISLFFSLYKIIKSNIPKRCVINFC